MSPPLFQRILQYLARHLDRGLIIGLIMLMATGLIVLTSASNGNYMRVLSQLLNMTVAFAVMWGFANIPPHYLMRLALPLFMIACGLLLGVAVAGDVVNGARRWLHLGVTRIQPSELMKIALPLMLAWYFNRHEASLNTRNYITAALILLFPVLLIARQPDLGTALLIMASGCYVIFLAGLSWRIIAGLAISGVASLPFLWSKMHNYQQQRILTLLDPSEDPLGSGYHTIQSTIAVGSGGILGKGWMNGTQTHLDFIPERTTDFIFAVFAEEFGLFVNLILITLFLFLIARALVITSEATTLFNRLIAGAITMTFFTYVFVNMGMVSGILPVVGVPLPLISYGGTSLVSICLGFGILMSIHSHKRLPNY